MPEASKENLFSRALVALMKGPISQDEHSQTWQTVIEQRAQIGDYVGQIGLRLIVDEVDGYAFLRQHDRLDGEEELPRIVQRQPLSYSVSLLLVLLRKRLLEFDESSGDRRLVLSRDQIIEMVSIFRQETSDQARLHDDIVHDIERVREYGFLRRLSGSGDDYEVQRIIRSVIDAEWLSEMNGKLEQYFLIGEAGEDGDKGADEGTDANGEQGADVEQFENPQGDIDA